MKIEAPEQESQRWKEKYLQSLDEMESLERTLINQIRAITSGFIQISRLAKGRDKKLDKQLEPIRRQLQENSLNKALPASLADLEKSITAARMSQYETQEQIIQTLEQSVEQLCTLALPSSIKKELRLFNKELRSKAEHFYHFPKLLEEFTRLQERVTHSLDSASKPGTRLIDRLFSKQRAPSLADNEKYKLNADQLNLETDPKPGRGFALTKYDTDGNKISEILLGLLQKMRIPTTFAAAQSTIEAHIRQNATPDTLADILKQISELLFTAWEYEQQELRKFLNSINERLTEIGTFLKKTQEHHQSNIQSNLSLSNNVRTHIATIQAEIQNSTDLDTLKKSIQSNLDEITNTITHYQEQDKQQSSSLTGQLQGLVERVEQMEVESKTIWAKLEEQKLRAIHDPLTLLPNRSAYNERMQEEYARWKRYQTPLSIAIGDIDFFKQINDTYGHLAGDKVLHATATLMKNTLRETDFIARYGGEEFVFVFTNTSIEDALNALEKLRKTVEHCPFHYRKTPVKVTLSFGVTAFINNDDSAETVLQRADRALYKAKHSGRNQCQVAED